MGSYIALQERCNLVSNTPTEASGLKKEIRRYAKDLEVVHHLHSYRATLEMQTMPGAHFYLVELDVPKGETRISGFKQDALETAQQMYLALEKETANQPGRDVVLVSVGSLESLKRAYPNYFADTDVFLGIVREAIR